MTNEEAQAFCDQRKAEIDRWTKVADPHPFTADSDVNSHATGSEGEWVSVSYWWWQDKDDRQAKRIHVAGRSLEEAVAKCKVKEGKG